MEDCLHLIFEVLYLVHLLHKDRKSLDEFGLSLVLFKHMPVEDSSEGILILHQEQVRHPFDELGQNLESAPL